MRLGPSELEQYKTEGYVSLPQFLTHQELEILSKHYNAVYEAQRAAGTLHNVAVTDGGEKKENLQIHYMCKYDEAIRAFLYSEKLLDLIQSIIGPNIRVYFEQGFWKPPYHGSPTDWHQDNHYFKVTEPRKGVGFWLALDKATRDNGCMWVIPGSHLAKVEHERDLSTDHLMRAKVDETHAVPVELEAGGAMVFDFETLHTTKANTTDTNRRALAVHFAASDAVSTDPMWLSREPREIALLRGRDSSHGEDEFGARLTGRWEEIVLQGV